MATHLMGGANEREAGGGVGGGGGGGGDMEKKIKNLKKVQSVGVHVASSPCSPFTQSFDL